MRGLLGTAGASLCATALLLTPAFGQSNRNDEDSRDRASARGSRTQSESQDRRSRSRADDRQSDSRSSQKPMISGGGEVVRTKKVQLRGARDEHLVVQLQMDGGNRRIVDLGPVTQFKRNPVKTGDRIVVRGHVARFGDHQVLMASQVRANDRVVDIQRRSRRDQQIGRREGSRERRNIAGRGRLSQQKVVQVRDRSGRTADHLVVLLETDQGHRRVVDLGPVENLRTMRLATGDTIAVKGQVIAVGDKQILVATDVQSGDRSARISRGSRQNEQRSRQISRDQEDDRRNSRRR